MQVATIVCRRELARARVLAASVAEFTGGSTVVLVLDSEGEGEGEAAEVAAEGFELLTPAAARIHELGVMAATLGLEELREACKPLLLRHLLAVEHRGDAVLYLDANSLLAGALDDVDELAARHGVVVKTRTTRPIPDDGRRPNEADLRSWGLHDSGLIALGRGHDHRALLEWWELRGRAGAAPDAGAAPLERIVGLGRAHEIDDLGVGLSFWDLAGRRVSGVDGGIAVDGVTVRLVRLPGFDPEHPRAISAAQDRLRPEEVPELAALCERYAQLLADAGEREAAALRYGFERLPDGTRLDHRLRLFYAEARERAPLERSPFTTAGMEEFYAWLSVPAAAGRAFGVNRLCMMMRDAHPELREAYPDLDSEADAYGMIEWIQEHGVREGTLPASVVPPSSPLRSEIERRRQARRTTLGVNVVGYFTAEMGLGEGHRLLVDALDAAAVPLLPMLPPTLPPSRSAHPYATVPLSTAGYPVNVIAINGDGLARFRDEVGSDFFAGHHNVGLWWWEVDTLPEAWLGAFELLDEIWVGSEHVAAALSALSPVPVHKIRFPVARPRVTHTGRDALALADATVFLAMFDYNSVVERKNPLGAITAFSQAFAPDSGAVLLLKSINGEGHPAMRERIHAAVAGRPHIRLLEEHLSRAQTNELIAACDCLVSLHRAEGFGHVLGEAMALAKPVVATAYSGNLEFMTPENSFLVDYSLRDVGPGCWPYPADAHWAEPDLDAAARLMRHVFDDPAAARRRGVAAAAAVARTNSLEAAGALMRTRIEAVTERWQGPPHLQPLDEGINITLGSRGRMLRRLAPGVIVRIERELDRLREANNRLEFELDATIRGPVLGTLAATLAALRRIERDAPARQDDALPPSA